MGDDVEVLDSGGDGGDFFPFGDEGVLVFVESGLYADCDPDGGGVGSFAGAVLGFGEVVVFGVGGGSDGLGEEVGECFASLSGEDDEAPGFGVFVAGGPVGGFEDLGEGLLVDGALVIESGEAHASAGGDGLADLIWSGRGLGMGGRVGWDHGVSIADGLMWSGGGFGRAGLGRWMDVELAD